MATGNVMLQTRESNSIYFLKIVACLMIVFIHVNHQMPPTKTAYAADSVYGLVLSVVRSTRFSAFGVPCFAFLSGFLFFLKNNSFTLSHYQNKIKSRFYSLFIPYVTWCLIAFIGDFILFKFAGVNNLVAKTDWNFLNVFNIFFAIKMNEDSYLPYNGPLWYIRDLIILALLSPAIWVLLKNKTIGILTIIFSLIFYRLHIVLWSHEARMLFYFLLGCFVGIHKVNFFVMAEKFFCKPIFTVLYACFSIFYFSTEVIDIQNEVVRFIVNPIYVISTILFLSYLGERIKSQFNFKKIAASTFVIYCSHNMLLSVSAKLIVGKSIFAYMVFYVCAPILCCALGFLFYLIIEKSRILSVVFLGKRTKRD